MKLDGATEAALARALSALPPDERGWITFVEARSLFSTRDAQYAFGEVDDDGKTNIETFAAQHQSVINFMPAEGRVYLIEKSDGAKYRPFGGIISCLRFNGPKDVQLTCGKAACGRD